MMGVNAALMEMLAPPESAGSGQGSGNDETTPARGSSMVEHLDDIDEEEEYDQEDNDAVGALTGPVSAAKVSLDYSQLFPSYHCVKRFLRCRFMRVSRRACTPMTKTYYISPPPSPPASLQYHGRAR